MHLPNVKTLLSSKTICTVIFSVHCIRIPHQFARIWLDDSRNIWLCFGWLNPKYCYSLCVCVFLISTKDFIFLNLFLRQHLILCLETLIGSTWRHQLYTFVFSRKKARGTAENKHDISVCIDDILCNCLTKRLCFSPKPFVVIFSVHCIRIPRQFLQIWLVETGNIRLIFT